MPSPSPRMPRIHPIFLVLILFLRPVAAAVLKADDVKPLSLLQTKITFKANFYTGSGDEEIVPIVRTEFYLFEQNPVDFLKKTEFKIESAGNQDFTIDEQDYLMATAHAFLSEDAESNLVSALIKENVFKPHSRTIRTDQAGQFQTDEIRLGRYYLFGAVEKSGEIFVWNFLFEIKNGANLIEIDQYNAEVVFPVEKIN